MINFVSLLSTLMTLLCGLAIATEDASLAYLDPLLMTFQVLPLVTATWLLASAGLDLRNACRSRERKAAIVLDRPPPRSASRRTRRSSLVFLPSHRVLSRSLRSRIQMRSLRSGFGPFMSASRQTSQDSRGSGDETARSRELSRGASSDDK